MTTAPPPTLLRRTSDPPFRPFLTGIIGYEEHGAAPPDQREVASLDVPVVVTLQGAFRIALDRPPVAADVHRSFAAGLHPGFVAIASDGAAACVQINFTPLGARLALGLPMDALAGRMVPLHDLPGTGLAELADRLADAPGWPERLATAEAWAAQRIRAGLAEQRPDARATAAAYQLLRRSAGAPRIAAIADRLGWSRKRLAARFREEIGLPPKSLARILRFMKAARMAGAAPPDWADIAAACGYSDQAHLTREFHALAGITPAAWAAARR